MDETKRIVLSNAKAQEKEKKEYRDETPKEVRGRMATMPVKKLMISMGLPMILSMMLQALYNIVDSAFQVRQRASASPPSASSPSASGSPAPTSPSRASSRPSSAALNPS